MPKRAASDKRQHPRVEARLAMQLAEETLGEALVTTESLNISRGGVYCESAEYLAPLSKVALTVVLPAFGTTQRPRVLRTEGVVVRCEGLVALRGRKRYQLACCFTGLDTEGRTLLDEFITWRALKSRRVTSTAAKPRSRTGAKPKAKAKAPAGAKAPTRRKAVAKTAARRAVTPRKQK
jgi:hypothetical protein